MPDRYVSHQTNKERKITMGQFIDTLGGGGSSEIPDGTITTPKLADKCVTTPKVGDGAITGIKIADDSISTPKMVDASVTTPKIANASVTNEKVVSITGDKISDYSLSDMSYDIEDLKGIVGYTDDNIIGIMVDYENKTYTRLGAARGKTMGADFDAFPMFGGRKRCNVADNGTINAYYGDEGYVEDGSNGQVMVYQPKFYYKIIPLKLDPITDSIGYHLRKAIYYVTDTPKTGFKPHPAFKDVNGNEIPYVLDSAYEGCIFDVSAADGEGAYLTEDEQVGSFTATTGDKLSSIAGVKPVSGLTQSLTRPNAEQIAKNRGDGWHNDNIFIESMTQLLMLIECGTCNFQSALGSGVTGITDNSAYNCSSLTGSTASLGNASGKAASTINTINGTPTTNTSENKVSVSYRGKENPYGNIWKFVYGINIHGNGSQRGGIPYIATDYNWVESKNTDNYVSAGFTLTNASGYVSAFGYGNPEFDWLFMASETTGNSSLPVGDYTYVTANLNGYKIAYLGGHWNYGTFAGGFYWACHSGVGYLYRSIGARLAFVPTAS